MSNTINVGGVETFSVVDYPEKIAAVVFMQGCPWRCPFCYNTAVQKIGASTDFVWDKFLDFLKQRRGKLDAIVFSGGEPLVQNGLEQAIDEVRALGFGVGLHTGGYRPEHLEKIIGKIDWVGLDIKSPLKAERYKQVTQTNHLKEVLQSLDIILKSGINFECRTTCDPRILSVSDIYEIADFLKEKGVKSYYLQKYRPVPTDTTTTDSDCEKFMSDKKLYDYLKSSFQKFDTRS